MSWFHLCNPKLRFSSCIRGIRAVTTVVLVVCFLTGAAFSKFCNWQDVDEKTSDIKYNTEFFPVTPDTSRCVILDGGDSMSLHWVISNNYPFSIELAGTSTGCSCTSVSVSSDTIDPGCKASIIATIALGKGDKRKARSGEIALTFLNVNDKRSLDSTNSPDLFKRYVHKRLYECIAIPSIEWPSEVVSSANGMDAMFEVRFFGERDLSRLAFISSEPGVKIEHFPATQEAESPINCRSVQVRASFPNRLDVTNSTDIRINLFAPTPELGSTAEVLIGFKLLQFKKKTIYAMFPKNVFVGTDDNKDIRRMITRRDGFPDVQSCKAFIRRNEMDTEIPIKAFESVGNLFYVNISSKDVVSEIHVKESALRIVATTFLGDIELSSNIFIIGSSNSKLEGRN